MIEFTQGDTATLDLTATNGNGTPVDLTAAVFTTSFRGTDGVVISFPNSQHTANPDQVNFKGQFSLALSSADTDSVPVGKNKEIVTKIVQGLSTIYYHGPSALNVLNKIPMT
jgi:hypothetical protein